MEEYRETYVIIVNKFDDNSDNGGSLKSRLSRLPANSRGTADTIGEVENKKIATFNEYKAIITEEISKSSYQNSLDKVDLITITAIFGYRIEVMNNLGKNKYPYYFYIEGTDSWGTGEPSYSIDSIISGNIVNPGKNPYNISNDRTYLYNIFKNGGTGSNRLGHINNITSTNESIYYLSGISQNIQFAPKNGSILHNGVFVYKKGENTAKKINCINNTCSLNPQSLNLSPCNSIDNGYDFTSDIAVKINISGFNNYGERYIKQGNPVIICSDDLGYLNGKHLSYYKGEGIKNIVDDVYEDTTINFLNSSENSYTAEIKDGSIKILNAGVNGRNIQITLDGNNEDYLYKIMIDNSSLVFKGRTLNLSNGEFHRMFGISISDIKPGFSKKINNIKYGPTTSTESFSIVYKQPALYFNGNPDNTTPTVVSVPNRDEYDVQQNQEQPLSMIIKNIELIKIGDRLIKINYPKYEENS